MESCPKCHGTISICQGGTRCQQCGYQERGVTQYQTNKSYQSHPSPGQARNRQVHDYEDLESLQSAWSRKPEGAVVNPLVSIVMPTYMRPHTIFLTVASVLNQTLNSWELIIVDNQEGNDYSFTDSRIKYRKHSEKQSAAYARNMGIQYITGSYVCFFDDDDIMKPTYLHDMTQPFLENPNIRMTICKIKLVEGRDTTFDMFCTPSAFIKREFVNATWSEHPGHDYLYLHDIASKLDNDSIYYVNSVLVNAYTSPRGGIRSGAL